MLIPVLSHRQPSQLPRHPLHIIAIAPTIAVMALWTIRAEYDPESACWWIADSDVPGLAADAATLDKLAEKVGAMLPDLLDIHADQLVDAKRVAGPHRLDRVGKGDHDVWAKPGSRSVVVDNGMLSRHTANAVLKQAGIKLKF